MAKSARAPGAAATASWIVSACAGTAARRGRARVARGVRLVWGVGERGARDAVEAGQACMRLGWSRFLQELLILLAADRQVREVDEEVTGLQTAPLRSGDVCLRSLGMDLRGPAQGSWCSDSEVINLGQAIENLQQS
jgi:hypothetical protein